MQLPELDEFLGDAKNLRQTSADAASSRIESDDIEESGAQISDADSLLEEDSDDELERVSARKKRIRLQCGKKNKN